MRFLISYSASFQVVFSYRDFQDFYNHAFYVVTLIVSSEVKFMKGIWLEHIRGLRSSGLGDRYEQTDVACVYHRYRGSRRPR